MIIRTGYNLGIGHSICFTAPIDTTFYYKSYKYF